MAKNNNIVGQGLAPAVWCKIQSMVKTVRPYDWIFKHCFKIRTPTNAFPLRGRGTAPAVDEVLGFNGWQKKGNPRRGFPSCTSCNAPVEVCATNFRSCLQLPCALRTQKRVSLSAESDQRRRLWKPPPFEKGGPKLYYLLWNFTDQQKTAPYVGRHSDHDALNQTTFVPAPRTVLSKALRRARWVCRTFQWRGRKVFLLYQSPGRKVPQGY